MSTITREWLQQKIADMETARDEIPFGLDEDDTNTLAALGIALASLETEPVAEWTNEQCLEFLSIAFRHAEINGDLQLDDIRLGVKMVNGSRAAMLQGAEPVTTAYKLPEGWVACSERMPEDRESVLLWDIDLDDACSGHYSHETGNFYQSGMIIDNEITHWMPLPAAPQQEVKNG